jgi:two-component system cell cycle sensor histidine kinase/response regulator CckA
VRILGYSREELKKLRTSDLMVPDNPDQARAIQRNRETEASTMRFGPISFRRKDGALTRFVGTSYVVDYRGERVRVAMLEDVTEKEKIERQMQQAQRLEALGQLAGGVAHDFNNLLTVILNVTASLRSAVGDPEAARDVERVDKAAQSARRLTRQLLAFARLEVVPLSALNVNEQLTELRDLLARTIGSHIDLVLDLDAEAAPVRMDRGQLEQVVINLSVNARDAMPKGGRLVISTRNFDVDDAFVGAGRDLSTGRYLRLQIGDSGSGMDKSTLDHAFEPFFTTKPVGQGTGMGLATVYGIVKQLKGHVSIYSEVGVGTTVTVLLPATDAPVRSAVVAPVAYTGPVSGTVLVVEDYSDLRELFDDFLTNAGYTVLVAGDGRAALEMAEQHRDRIDLLLTDIVMPNMLGTDLAAELKMKRPALRVLYMSGHAQPIFSGATPLPDGVKLLQKPFLESELLDSIREVMAAPAIDEVHV